MSGDLEVLKEIPGYKAILKSVLKSQIQMLVEQLSEHTGEETILLTASLHDGTLSHQGSSTGKGFLEGRDEIKSQFLGYCLKSHHKKKSTDTRPSPYQRPQTSGRISPALGSPSKKAPRLQVQPVSLQRVVPSDNTGTPNSNKRPPDVHGAPSQVFTSDSSAEQSSVSVKLESNESGVSSGDSENLTTTTTFPSSIHQNHTLTAGDINTSENNDSQNNTDNYTEISSMNDDSSTANTCIKIEPITENEMELEITGVEPGKVSMQSDSWSHSPSGFGITPTSVVEASSFSNETNDSSYTVNDPMGSSLCGAEWKDGRVLFLGLSESGKTTALYRLKMEQSVITVPTYGYNSEKIKIGKHVHEIWDVGGNIKERADYLYCMSDVAAVVYFIDCAADSKRYQLAFDKLDLLLAESQLEKCSVAIAANKQDLKTCISTEDIKTTLSDKKWMTKRFWKIFPVTATSGEGLEPMMKWVQSHLWKVKKEPPTEKPKRTRQHWHRTRSTATEGVAIRLHHVDVPK